MFFRAGIWPENVPAALSTPWNPPGTLFRPKNEDSSIKLKRFDPNLFILMELSSFFGLHRTSLAPREASVGPREASVGPRVASLGPRVASLGPREASLGPTEASLGGTEAKK